MELDFRTVKALSSPTRIQILSQLLEKERTPTQLSTRIDRSKSTVSSHLETLVDTGLVEKDQEEGRKRVVYRPTSKAETIVKGRERKVRFSLASSALTGLAGLGIIGTSMLGSFRDTAATYSSGGAREMTAMTADAAKSTAESAASQPPLVTPENLFLGAGIFLLSLSAGTLVYGLLMRRIGSGS